MHHSEQRLRAKIQYLLRPFGVSEEAQYALLLAYSEAWRTYHNADHILKMLDLSRKISHLSDEHRQRLELMILYHDAWYKVGRPTGENERKSAEWSKRDLSKKKTKQVQRVCRIVEQGILATIKHSLENVESAAHEEVSLLLDLDLWSLGQKPELFYEDSEKIWHEFQPILTREQFDINRKRWACSFLESRKNIYHTEEFSHLEAQARRNLEGLIS